MLRVVRRPEQLGVYIVDPRGSFVAHVVAEGLIAERFAASEDLLAACKLALRAFEKSECINWETLAQAITKAETPCTLTNIGLAQ